MMMEHKPESAPLVATNYGEAVDAMISEGGPILEPQPDVRRGPITQYHARVLKQVDRHPIYSVGIAFGFGFVLGLLVEP